MKLLTLVLATLLMSSATAQPPVDVLFAVDESLSMTGIQVGFKTQVSNIFNQLSAVVPHFRVGLVGFGQLANNGNPVLRQDFTANQASFQAAVNALQSNGDREPGYFAAQAIAMNNVSGAALNTDPKYPGAHPGPEGFCLVLVSNEDSDGPETLADTVAHLVRTGGRFFGVTNGQQGYIDLATATGGTSHDLRNFVADSAPVLSSILATCITRIQCTATTYHVWDSSTETEVTELYNGWKGCIREPFNLEVRLCDLPKTPVQLKLWSRNSVFRHDEYHPSWMLFGDKLGDIFNNTKPLPNDTYRFYARIDGVTTFVTFTQACLLT